MRGVLGCQTGEEISMTPCPTCAALVDETGPPAPTPDKWCVRGVTIDADSVCVPGTDFDELCRRVTQFDEVSAHRDYLLTRLADTEARLAAAERDAKYWNEACDAALLQYGSQERSAIQNFLHLVRASADAARADDAGEGGK